MNASAITDLLDSAEEAQSLSHDMSLRLRQIAGGLDDSTRRELRLLAAAAENVSDRIMMIIESAKNDN